MTTKISLLKYKHVMPKLNMDLQIRRPMKGDTVSINYIGKFEDGTVFDSSAGREPLQFVVGKGHVIEGMDEAVLSMEKGESKTISIPFEKAYGKYHEEYINTIDRHAFPPDLALHTGQRLEITGHDGTKSMVNVIALSESTVSIDYNHPLAGKNLVFDIELIDTIPSDMHFAEIFFEEGVRQQDDEKLDEAIDCYKKTTELNPDHASAFYNMGVAYQKKGEVDRAKICYQIALQLNPNQ